MSTETSQMNNVRPMERVGSMVEPHYLVVKLK